MEDIIAIFLFIIYTALGLILAGYAAAFIGLAARLIWRFIIWNWTDSPDDPENK